MMFIKINGYLNKGLGGFLKVYKICYNLQVKLYIPMGFRRSLGLYGVPVGKWPPGLPA